MLVLSRGVAVASTAEELADGLARARAAIAVNRHLIVSFPDKVPARLKDAVQVA